MQARGHAAADTLVQAKLHHAGRKGSYCSVPVMQTAMHHEVPCGVCGLHAGILQTAMHPCHACQFTAGSPLSVWLFPSRKVYSLFLAQLLPNV